MQGFFFCFALFFFLFYHFPPTSNTRFSTFATWSCSSYWILFLAKLTKYTEPLCNKYKLILSLADPYTFIRVNHKVMDFLTQILTGDKTFQMVDKRVLVNLALAFQYLELEYSQVLYLQGDQSPYAYYVISGSLSMHRKEGDVDGAALYKTWEELEKAGKTRQRKPQPDEESVKPKLKPVIAIQPPAVTISTATINRLPLQGRTRARALPNPTALLAAGMPPGLPAPPQRPSAPEVPIGTLPVPGMLGLPSAGSPMLLEGRRSSNRRSMRQSYFQRQSSILALRASIKFHNGVDGSFLEDKTAEEKLPPIKQRVLFFSDLKLSYEGTLGPCVCLVSQDTFLGLGSQRLDSESKQRQRSRQDNQGKSTRRSRSGSQMRDSPKGSDAQKAGGKVVKEEQRRLQGSVIARENCCLAVIDNYYLNMILRSLCIPLDDHRAILAAAKTQKQVRTHEQVRFLARKLKKVDFMSRHTRSIRHRFCRLFEYRRFEAFDVLASQGDTIGPHSEAYIIITGSVSIHHQDDYEPPSDPDTPPVADGRKKKTSVKDVFDLRKRYGPCKEVRMGGQVFGSGALLSNNPYPVTGICRQTTEVLAISRGAYLKIFRSKQHSKIEDHRRVASILKRVNGPLSLSSKDVELLDEVLKDTDFFRNMSGENREFVYRSMSYCALKKDTIICRQQQAAKYAFVAISGFVGVYSNSVKHDELAVGRTLSRDHHKQLKDRSQEETQKNGGGSPKAQKDPVGSDSDSFDDEDDWDVDGDSENEEEPEMDVYAERYAHLQPKLNAQFHLHEKPFWLDSDMMQLDISIADGEYNFEVEYDNIDLMDTVGVLVKPSGIGHMLGSFESVDKKYTNSLVAVEDSGVLVIPMSAWESKSGDKEVSTTSTEKCLDFLSGLNVLAGVDRGSLIDVAKVMQHKVIPRGHTIVQQGDLTKSVIFIAKGDCRALRTIKLLNMPGGTQTRPRKKNKVQTWEFKPQAPGQPVQQIHTPLLAEDQEVDFVIDLAVMNPGEVFGVSEAFKKAHPAPCSLQATHVVEVYTLGVESFLNFFPRSCMRTLKSIAKKKASLWRDRTEAFLQVRFLSKFSTTQIRSLAPVASEVPSHQQRKPGDDSYHQVQQQRYAETPPEMKAAAYGGMMGGLADLNDFTRGTRSFSTEGTDLEWLTAGLTGHDIEPPRLGISKSKEKEVNGAMRMLHDIATFGFAPGSHSMRAQVPANKAVKLQSDKFYHPMMDGGSLGQHWGKPRIVRSRDDIPKLHEQSKSHIETEMLNTFHRQMDVMQRSKYLNIRARIEGVKGGKDSLGDTQLLSIKVKSSGPRAQAAVGRIPGVSNRVLSSQGARMMSHSQSMPAIISATQTRSTSSPMTRSPSVNLPKSSLDYQSTKYQYRETIPTDESTRSPTNATTVALLKKMHL